MAKQIKIENFLDTVQKIVQDKCVESYTGVLTIKIVFSQGGIRSCEQQMVEIIYPNKSDS